jgi:hypothetical protein
MAKKGDVFLWTADLVHLSHPRTLPPETPRLSCVTHYCPMTATPFWFRFHPENRGLEPYDEAGAQGAFTSRYYPLPNGGRMIPPNRTQ